MERGEDTMELEEDMLCRSDAVGFVLMQWGGGEGQRCCSGFGAKAMMD